MAGVALFIGLSWSAVMVSAMEPVANAPVATAQSVTLRPSTPVSVRS
jgi:hypothetical protein